MASGASNRFAVPVALLVLAMCGWAACLLAGRRPVATPTTAPASLRLDPNTASWQELACLPAIGESVARRIVTYREQHDGKPFRTIHDLESIKGIGPRALEHLSPYLHFPSNAPGLHQRHEETEN